MKTLLMGLLLAQSLSALAYTPEQKKSVLEAQTSCGNFVRFDDQYLSMGFGPYKEMFEEPRSPIPGMVTLVSMETRQERVLNTNDSAIDMTSKDGHAFILTYSGIEEWDLASATRIAEYPTHTETAVSYKEHAESFARFGDELIIAHGIMGVSFFDLNTKKVTGTLELLARQAPLVSQATAVAVRGNLAYVTMDSYSLVSQAPYPFSGIVVIDLTTKKVVSEMTGLDVGSDAIASFGDKLIVSFYGLPVWKYDATDFKGRKLPNPEIRVFRFPFAGHPMGAAAVDEKYYYTCFSFSQTPEQEQHRAPLALNRKVLMLD